MCAINMMGSGWVVCCGIVAVESVSCKICCGSSLWNLRCGISVAGPLLRDLCGGISVVESLLWNR